MLAKISLDGNHMLLAWCSVFFVHVVTAIITALCSGCIGQPNVLVAQAHRVHVVRKLIVPVVLSAEDR